MRAPAHAIDAKTLLDEIARLERRARRALSAFWFPLVVFGILACASSAFTGSGNRQGIFWAFALLVCAPVAASLASGAWKAPAAWMVVGIAYVLFALLERSVVVAAIALVMGIAGLAFGLADHGDSPLLPALIGVLMIAVGGWARWASTARA